MATQNLKRNVSLNLYREGENITLVVCFLIPLKRERKHVWRLQPVSSIWRPLAFLPVTLSVLKNIVRGEGITSPQALTTAKILWQVFEVELLDWRTSTFSFLHGDIFLKFFSLYFVSLLFQPFRSCVDFRDVSSVSAVYLKQSSLYLLWVLREFPRPSGSPCAFCNSQWSLNS